MDFNFRDHRYYMVHLLRVLHRRGPIAPGEIYDEVADLAGVTPTNRTVIKEGEGNPVYRNRIQFARQSLIDVGAVIGSSEPGWQRGIWALSPEGHHLASRILDEEQLDAILRERATEGARQRAERRRESRALAGIDQQGEVAESELMSTSDEAEPYSPEPSIAMLVDLANESVMDTMLERVRSMNDRAFEHLVGNLLLAALRAESVRITPRSHDGGIDGVLHFDSLGLRTAAFEAKRYADGRTVGRPLIDAFATAARRRKADHALFVTSSTFSSGAIQAGRQEGIRLVDGVAFVELMARHGIGFQEAYFV